MSTWKRLKVNTIDWAGFAENFSCSATEEFIWDVQKIIGDALDDLALEYNMRYSAAENLFFFVDEEDIPEDFEELVEMTISECDIYTPLADKYYKE